MRTLVLLFLGVGAAFSQPVSFGVKAGVPLTDFINTVKTEQFQFDTVTNRYIIGPTVELHLPAGLGIEFDALYRRMNYSGSATLTDALATSHTTTNAWEFPLLLKYRMATPVIKPFVDAGVAFDTLSGLKQTVTNTLFPGNNTTTTTTGSPSDLKNKTTVGLVIGGGLDIHAVFLHISPEVRYTRWGSEHFRNTSGVSSNRNQAEFLVGFTF